MPFELPEKVIPPAFVHQVLSTQFQVDNESVFDMSDPGTGKTRAFLDAFAERKRLGISNKALVLAPKSILVPAWAKDIEKFQPDLTYSVANAANRVKAFEKDADVYITNHDAAKWLVKNPWAYLNCTDLAIDESTAYKNPQAQRSKAIKKISGHFVRRIVMTGTPAPNTVCDIWNQAFLVDDGERLGHSFWKFRAACCEPVQVGPAANMLQWHDKEGSFEAVAALLGDIAIRNVFETCIDIPENFVTEVDFQLPFNLRKKYNEMAEHALIQLASDDITAANSAVLTGKLLQLASGAVYDNDSATQVFATERYELIIELIKQRNSCLVAYNWGHQLEELCKIAKREGIPYEVINGSVNDAGRIQAVERFQAGEVKVIFAHPKSAAHGLTLTQGTTTIWTSPTWSSEQYTQFNKRIYRAGQRHRTETIHITAEDTLEEYVYEKLQGKIDAQSTLLDMLGV